jgi:phage terminase Nu1 subunit (DNA packaging protein)
VKQKCTSSDDLPKVSAEVVADLFGVSRQTFASWLNDDVLSRQKPASGYDLRVVCRALLKDYARRAAGRGEEGEMRVLASARARAATAAAEERELRNGILKGEYVHCLVIRRAWERIAAAFRECALSLPGKVAASLALGVGRERDEVHEVLDREVRELLEVLSGGADISSGDEEAVHDGQRGRAARAGDGDGFAGDVGLRAGRSVDRGVPGRSEPRAGRIAGPHRSHQERSGGGLLSHQDGGAISLR